MAEETYRERNTNAHSMKIAKPKKRSRVMLNDKRGYNEQKEKKKWYTQNGVATIERENMNTFVKKSGGMWWKRDGG
jgi:hypothetical protein